SPSWVERLGVAISLSRRSSRALSSIMTSTARSRSSAIMLVLRVHFVLSWALSPNPPRTLRGITCDDRFQDAGEDLVGGLLEARLLGLLSVVADAVARAGGVQPRPRDNGAECLERQRPLGLEGLDLTPHLVLRGLREGLECVDDVAEGVSPCVECDCESVPE